MSEAKFSPLLRHARHAQLRRMEMQCDPQWVLDVFAERDTLRAEVERLQQALAEQPDTVPVPREQLEQLLDRVAHREDPDKIANELCSILLGKEGEK